MKLTVNLAPVLYLELVEAAEKTNCLGEDHEISPQRFAQEAIESVLADRRLDKITRISA